MKKLMGVAAIAILLGGCAGTQTRFNPYSWYSSEDVDLGKIAAVNDWAQRKGATVMWINYPAKPKPGTAGN
ncbi:MAG: hypothetical protein ABI846_00375 [Rudaea sp.]